MKKCLFAVFVILAVFSFVGCGRGGYDDEDIDFSFADMTLPELTPPPTEPETEPEPEPESPPAGMAISRLTGLYICEEAYARRPFAVVYNNEPRAMPQMGLMQASIIYEMLSESAITRLVAIFQDFDAEMIGPIRSSRHYMARIAADHRAVFVHHGNSPQGGAAIGQHGLYRVDGMVYDGSVIWRDPVRRAERGLEHSSFTSAENLLELTQRRGNNMDAPDNLGLFEFFDEPTAPSPNNVANIVNIPFHGSNVSVFRYCEENYTYYKYIFGAAHMDDYAGVQISVTNILVQVANIYIIPGDPEGRRNIGLIGEGHGYLVTHGTYTRVRWEKPDDSQPTRWFWDNGNPLEVNRGITWISIISGQPTFLEE